MESTRRGLNGLASGSLLVAHRVAHPHWRSRQRVSPVRGGGARYGPRRVARWPVAHRGRGTAAGGGGESRAAYSSYAAGGYCALHYLGRLRRIQRMIDSVLPIMHSAENPTMNQVISGKFAMPRIRRPNQMATSPMRVNRTVRKPKT